MIDDAPAEDDADGLCEVGLDPDIASMPSLSSRVTLALVGRPLIELSSPRLRDRRGRSLRYGIALGLPAYLCRKNDLPCDNIGKGRLGSGRLLATPLDRPIPPNNLVH
jgi:hypothetical protein